MSNTDFNANADSSAVSPNGDPSPQQTLGAAAGAVKQEVATFAASVQDKAAETVAERKDTASETLGAFANAIRHAGDELAQQDQSLAGRMVKQAADGLEQVSRTISDKRPEELLSAVRDFGRRNPTAFIAGSVLLGVALGRFARSSETHAQDSRIVPSQDFGQSVQALGGDIYRDDGAAEPRSTAAPGFPSAVGEA